MKEKNVCKGLTFADCELAILRMAVDKAEEKIGKRIVSSDDLKEIIKIVEDFIKRKSLICYGGTAINNILPEEDQFYNKDVEVPDYDFFSADALSDAKELADVYYKKGFTDVEAKSGQHHGTYKVFVNYMPIADITFVPKEIFNALKADSISVGGILYAPPNFLRMSMYLELSRPAGDISRWEKVLKRLTLLNKHHPITNINCSDLDYQREMSNKGKEDDIFENVRNTLINQGVVFFGGLSLAMYSQYMPKNLRQKLENVADFDVLSNDPETTAEIVKERLKDINIKNVKVIKHDPVGEIVPVHYEIKIGGDTIAFIYKPIACHSYNVVKIKGQKIKVGTIDTMLSFYLAFLYSNRPYYSHFLERNICIAKFLFDVQQKNRLEQKGLLRRFSITCYGHQESVEEMRAAKAKKYKELKNSKNKKLYDEWFMSYKPDEEKSKPLKVKSVSSKKPRKKKTQKGFLNLFKKTNTRRKRKN